MIIYLDTGFFIDYFSRRSMVATNFRTKSRRGRSVDQIQKDSESVMKKLRSQEAITSVITALEYNENTFDVLKKHSFGLKDITIDNMMRTKSETAVFYKQCEKNKIRLTPLDNQILTAALRNPDYDELKTNDAIHVQTARSNKAAIIISTDGDLLKWDRKFDGIMIVDTDDALKLF
jgi:predicted nucleic acid-binding protein